MKRLAFLIVVISISFVSCKKESTVNYNGKIIDKIDRQVVMFSDGTSLDLSANDKLWYLTRHAEKDTAVNGNPDLTREGFLRAAKLADMFKGSQLDAIYTTLYQRCISTIDSVSQLKAMPIRPYKASKIKGLVDSTRLEKDLNHILIVGHSNTIPGTANVIVGRQEFTQAIDEDVYDNFIIITESETDTVQQIYKLKY
jgi:phosphohistidine phosphatase SixA